MTGRRLIEEDFPLKEVSAEGGREKSLRKGHISTLHMWWARRPLVMARAMTIGLLTDASKVDTDDALSLIREFANFDRSLDLELVRRARKLVQSSSGGKPRILDPFSGGGAIPLEALRVGADVHAFELNPVAYLLLLCTCDYPIRFKTKRSPRGLIDRGLLSVWVRRAAGRLREIAESETAPFYAVPTGRPAPNGYIWARTVQCENPSCRTEIPLLSSRWLDDKPTRRRAINISVSERGVELSVAEGDDIQPNPEVGTVQGLSVRCPVCSSSFDRVQLRRIGSTLGYGARLVAVIEPGARRSNYRMPEPADIKAAQAADEHVSKLDPIDGMSPFPDEEIPYSNLQVPYIYGFTSWDKFFNSRQKILLSTLSRAVHEIYSEVVEAERDPEFARAVATYLGLLIDRIADRNSTFSSWTVGGQKIRNTFARQGISNVWDYVESNPFGSGSGSWEQAIDWVVDVINHCEQVADEPAKIQQVNRTGISGGSIS